MKIAKIVMEMDDRNKVEITPSRFPQEDVVSRYVDAYKGVYTREQMGKALTVAQFIFGSKF